jgi:hypothetical protein
MSTSFQCGTIAQPLPGANITAPGVDGVVTFNDSVRLLSNDTVLGRWAGDGNETLQVRAAYRTKPHVH